jgi:hypothetical protein
MSKIDPLANDAFTFGVIIARGLNLMLPEGRSARLDFVRAMDCLAKALAEAADMVGQAALRGLQAGLEARLPKSAAEAQEALADALARLAACIALGVTEAKKRQDHLVMKLRRCTEVRREMPTKRKEAIDALLGEGYLRSEIYEQMRAKHGKLIPGRGKDKRGEDKEFMDQDSMWRSYKASGGRHPKALRPRGRPKENGGNCNNGNSAKK